MTLAALLLTSFIVAVGVLVGVVGGRRVLLWRMNQRFEELWESLAGLERRLSKREGQAGQAARGKAPDLAGLAQLGMLQKLLGGAPRAQAPTEEDRHREANRFFRKRDANGTTEGEAT